MHAFSIKHQSVTRRQYSHRLDRRRSIINPHLRTSRQRCSYVSTRRASRCYSALRDLKSHKYVCITTYQPDTKSYPDHNPTTKQHATVNIQQHRRTQDFTMEGFHVMGAGPGGLGDGSLPVGSRGKAPVGCLGDEEKCKISVQFLTFSCIKFLIQ